MSRLIILAVIGLQVLLSACGAGNKNVDLPDERPFGKVHGKVMNGSFRESTVSVYTIADNGDLGFISKTKVDEEGNYSLDIRERNQPMLLVLTDGSYLEAVTSRKVDLKDGDRLNAVFFYESGFVQRVNITPITHISSALVFNGISNDQPASIALSNTLNKLNLFYGFNILNPELDTNLETSQNLEKLSATLKSKLLTSGLFQQVADQFLDAEGPSIDSLTTISLLSLMYRDVIEDGKLDGLGVAGDDKVPVNLMFGVEALGEKFYQLAFSGAVLRSKAFEDADEDSQYLKTFIYDLANTEVAVFDASSKKTLLSEEPLLDLVKSDSPYFSGIAEIAVKLEGVVRFSNATADFNGEQLTGVVKGNRVSFEIDTKSFENGEYEIAVNAIDEFEQTGSNSFKINFDNTLPVVELTSPVITNQKIMRLKGIYSDRESGLSKITVDGKPAFTSDDGAWLIELELEDGDNTLRIEATDVAGNTQAQTSTILLDRFPPSILSEGNHGDAQFVSPSITPFTETLKDENETAIYFDLDFVESRGTEVTKQNLIAERIPFFAFNIEDMAGNGMMSPAEALSLSARLEINNVLVKSWDQLPSDDGLFLLPLSREFLGEGWLNASVEDLHTISVSLTDAAGNETEKQFNFYSQFFVGQMDLRIQDEKSDQDWETTVFANRLDLHNSTRSAIAYELNNTSDFSFYINLTDDSIHQLEQRINRQKKENKIKLIATEKWRIGRVSNAYANCPEFSGWTSVDSIWNFDESGEPVKEMPKVIPPEYQFVNSDTPDTPPDSQWVDLPDFDEHYGTFEDVIAGEKLSFKYDYLVDTGFSSHSQPALLTDWQLTLVDTGEVVSTCDNLRNLQKREVYQVEQEAGFPRIESGIDVNITEFVSSGFKVFEEDGTEINQLEGWFRVPAVSKVKIVKFVKTPDVPVYEDPEASDTSLIADYEKYVRDEELIWSIKQNLKVDFSFNPPGLDFSKAVKRNTDYVYDLSVYKISRQ